MVESGIWRVTLDLSIPGAEAAKRPLIGQTRIPAAAPDYH